MIHLTIVTPENMIYNGEAQRITVRTLSGDITILPKHIDYAGALGRGRARFTAADGTIKQAVIDGGMIHAAQDNVHVITSHFNWEE